MIPNTQFGSGPLQQISPQHNPDCWNWAGFTTNNPAFQPYNFDSNWVSEFWSYGSMINI